MNSSAPTSPSPSPSPTWRFTTLDIVCTSCAVGLLLLYNVYYAIEVKRNPRRTNLGVNIKSRKRWTIFITKTPGQEILAVQTLRNSIMLSSFLATASITIVVFLGAYALNDASKTTLREVQYLSLIALNVIAFLNMTLAVRNWSHIGFLLNSRDTTSKVTMDEFIAPINHLTTAGTVHNTIGVRCYYLMAPVGAWLFSAPAFLGCAVALIIFMCYADHAVTSGFHHLGKENHNEIQDSIN